MRISNAGEVIRVYLGYKCSKKKMQPESCRAGASCADLPNCGLVLAPLLLACAGRRGVAELSLPPTKSQHSVIF